MANYKIIVPVNRLVHQTGYYSYDVYAESGEEAFLKVVRDIDYDDIEEDMQNARDFDCETIDWSKAVINRI